ncbi:MAG: sugar ABC transporter permease [Tepidisphaeraceae bacterium]|jgi:multiple sugar transport system permease protein
MSRDAKNLLKGLAFLSPWLVGFAAFTLIPIALSLYYSFCNYSLVQSPLFCGWDNYRQLMHDDVFWLVLRNTFLYAAMALPGGLIFALLLALLLNQKVPGQSIFRTVVFIPSLVPTIASAALWLWLLNQKLGLVNLVLGTIGIHGPGWLTDTRWVLPGLALMSIWACGNTVVIYLAGLQDVPRELYEAAELDGAGPLRRLWHVTLPMLSPVIFFNLVIAIIGVLQVFDAPYLMTQGGPNRASYFFTYYLYDSGFTYLRMGYASAMGWIQLLIVLAMTGLAFWSSKKWVYYQGK